MLVEGGFNTTTHNGVKSKFSEQFIKTGLFLAELGRIFSQLFKWSQKGDYADLFDFTEEKVTPYFDPVEKLIELAENSLK